MTTKQLLDELWERVMLETIGMDQDVKYLIRGVVQSVIHDMKEVHPTDE